MSNMRFFYALLLTCASFSLHAGDENKSYGQRIEGLIASTLHDVSEIAVVGDNFEVSVLVESNPGVRVQMPVFDDNKKRYMVTRIEYEGRDLNSMKLTLAPVSYQKTYMPRTSTAEERETL